MNERVIRAIHRIMSNPCVELVAGLIIAGVAIWTLFGLAGLAEYEVAARLHGDHGLLVLGMFLVVWSLAMLFEGIEFIAEGTHGIMAICHRGIVGGQTAWLGIVLLGLSMLAKGFLGLVDALLIVGNGSSLSRPAWLERVDGNFRHPRVEALVAVVVTSKAEALRSSVPSLIRFAIGSVARCRASSFATARCSDSGRGGWRHSLLP